MSDILKRLRDPHPILPFIDDPHVLYDAADEIERLREEVQQLTLELAALQTPPLEKEEK